MRPLGIAVALFGVVILIASTALFLMRDTNLVPAINQIPTPSPLAAAPETSFPSLSFKTDPTTANITQNVAAAIGKDLLERNPEGPATVEDTQWINVLDPEKFSENLIAEGLKQFDPQEFQPAVPRSSLKITSSADAASQQLYLKTFHDILRYRFGTTAVDLGAPELTGLNNLIGAYDRALTDFYNLPVPENLASVHQKEISLLTGQKKIFEHLIAYRTDPVQALLALQTLQQLNQQFSQLNDAIAEVIKTNQLAI